MESEKKKEIKDALKIFDFIKGKEQDFYLPA